MMTPTPMLVQQVPYLVDDASYDDYLSERGDVPGIWRGKGPKLLNLVGAVDGPSLTNLLNGMSPDGSTPLIQHSAIRKDSEHQAGTMLNCSAPKSVSGLFALGDPWVSRHVEESQGAATKGMVEHFEEYYAFTRRGSGGKRLERCFVVASDHMHFTNRNRDPQVHSHVAMTHIAVQPGRTGTIVNRPLFEHQMELGRVYRAILEMELINRLGVKTEPDGFSFRIVGFPKALEIEFSTRRPEVLAEMDRRGTVGREASNEAAKATAKPKQHVSRAALDEDWRRRAAIHGFGEAEIRALVKAHPYRETISEALAQRPVALMAARTTPYTTVNTAAAKANDPKIAPDRAVVNQPALKVVTPAPREKLLPPRAPEESPNVQQFREFARTFGKGGKPVEKSLPAAKESPVAPKAEEPSLSPVDRMTMKRLIAASFEVKAPKDSVYRLIDHLMDKVVASQKDHQRRDRELGTPEERSARLEAIVSTALSASTDYRHAINANKVAYQFDRLGGQAEPFREAAINIVSNRGAAAVIQSGAGVEKETFLRTLRNIYETAGYNVIGVTATGTAAAAMEAATDIKTHTVAQFLYHVSPTSGQILKHHASQMLEALRNHPTRAFDRWSVNDKTVLVVSDAQNLDSKEIQWLQLAATQAHAKILLAGDPQQYKAREPGNAFDSLREKLGAVKLPDSPRPTEHWAQDAIRQVSYGDVTGALSQFAMADRLILRDDYNQAAASLIRVWSRQTEKDRKDAIIIAPNSDQAKVLNRAAQHIRQQNGEVGRILKQRMNGDWVYRNDRVQFLRNSKVLGYRSGDQGHVERIGFEGVTIRLDRDRSFLGLNLPQKVFVPHKRYGDVTLGYALDAFRAQSITAKNAFVLTDANPTDARTLRSQISRATDDTRVFTARHCVDEEVEQIHDVTQFDIMEKVRNAPLVINKNLHPLVKMYDDRFGRDYQDPPRPKLKAAEPVEQPKAETQNPAEDAAAEQNEHLEGPRLRI